MRASIHGLLVFLFAVISASIIYGREIPVKNLPAPLDVSPQLKNAIDLGFPSWWSSRPTNSEEWKKLVQENAKAAKTALPALLKSLEVTYTAGKINNVPVYTLQPKVIPHENTNRILLHLHGGGYVFNPGEAGLGEAVYMAGIGGFKVISVDYRMPPDHPYPAAMEDAMLVYRQLIKDYPARNIGVFGTSTGGGMALALVLMAKAEGLPLPGAIAPGTPWSDLTKTGDSYFSNEFIDNILVSYDGWLKEAAKLYANGEDLKTPYLSPVYGDLKGFPPTILGTGTRDLFLSNTARVHRKLREAGAVADLLVIDGLSHAQYMLMTPDTPETLYYFSEVAKFFDKYLGKWL